MESLTKKKFKFPSSIIILFILICIVTLMTYIVPAGNFERVTNEAGITTVDAASYTLAEQTPVNPFRLFVSIYDGFIDGSSIIFLIIFGYFWVFSVVGSGAVTAGIERLLKGKAKDSKLFIPIAFLVFAIAGSTYGEFETVYGLIPIFVALAIAMGYDAIVGVGICFVGVATGFASATTNPFTIGIAQSYAELPLFSGLGLRWIIFVCFSALAVIYLMKYADKVKKDPVKSVVYGEDFSSFTVNTSEEVPFTTTHKILLIGMILTIAMIVVGTLTLGWWIGEMSAVFLISGIVSQIIARKKAEDIAKSLITACAEMSVAVVVVGLSRTILSILTKGNIIDTVIYALYQPMKNAPTWLVGILMLVSQNIINFFIPSGSGQAAAIMPIMTPLADLAGINRQIAVLAYQFGDGYSNMLWPTAGCAVACGISRIPLGKWYKFFLPLFGLMFVLQAIFIIVAVLINYGPF